MLCLLHRANATQFDKSYRRASNITKLFNIPTLAIQPRSSGWLSQPWGHWQWQQLATAADSWIFIDPRTQTRAECKHAVDTAMHFQLETEPLPHSWRHAPSPSARIQLSHVTTYASRHYITTETALLIFHFLQRFSPEWPIRTCSMITAVQFAVHWWW